MTEFTIKLADDRGRVQEQVHTAATAEELRTRFTQAGYLVYSVKAKSMLGKSTKKKVKLETFLIFNQQFLTLIRAGLPILSSLELLAKRQKDANLRGKLEDVAARVKTGEAISSAFEAQGGFLLVIGSGFSIPLLRFGVPRSGRLYAELGTKLRAVTFFRLDLGKAAQSY